MESSSSSPSRNWRFNVFPSFCGEDLRKNFLSHFLKELQRKGITTFIDHEIKRSKAIGPELVAAIRGSRMAVILLSKNYASSTWCLNELLEIMSCKEAIGQTVMPVFYEVDPSDVRKQAGDFGNIFEETCLGKSEEVRQRWSRALTDLANLAGVDSRLWNNEADMIEKLALDISSALNVTPSRDFDDLVGIEAHIKNLKPLLSLESSEVRMVGVWGPAGIGKTTIARALYTRLSPTFQHSAFMGNIKETYRRINLDDYGSKLHMQEEFLSKLINHKDVKIPHSGVVRERLKDKRVFVVLDDVDELEQLIALAKEPRWFGPGSRIVVTTQDRQLLKAHGIHLVYKVELPSPTEALEIFCQSAFGQNHPCVGIRELALRVTHLAGYLPLSLTVLGSYLRGFSKEEWEYAMPRLTTSLDGKIEKTLRFSYDALHSKDKSIFLHIACLFNGKNVEDVKMLLENSNLDVDHGLKALADKSLIDTHWGCIHMHSLLQKMGREIVCQQSVHEPGKRQFLVDAEEIRDVLACKSGTATVLGISFDASKINGELSISKKAFKGMHNLQFLEIYKTWNAKSRLNLPQGLNYLPHKLRLLHWDSFPMRSLPSKFSAEFLVELRMRFSKLEKLWEGIIPLRSLKVMDVSYSRKLKEIPNLSNATNLKKFSADRCESLSAFPHVPDCIEELELSYTGITEVPPWIKNLCGLQRVCMTQCSKLTNISMNVSKLENLEEVDFSGSVDGILFTAIVSWLSGVKKRLTIKANNIEEMLPKCLPRKAYTSPVSLDLSGNEDIKTISDCIKHFSQLHKLDIGECRKLTALPQLPESLSELNAQECESLERIHGSFHNPDICLNFANCLKLNREARELICASPSRYTILPGEEQPGMFKDQTSGDLLKVVHMIQRPFPRFLRYKACIRLLARSAVYDDDSGGIARVACCIRRICDGSVVRDESRESHIPVLVKDHLFTFGGSLILNEGNEPEVDATFSELMFEFKANIKMEIKGCQFTVLGGKRAYATYSRWNEEVSRLQDKRIKP
ncbi:unnamed protein product [Brassica rapa]|uniref:ADP-ribosyl cyclase/cyclic ADP-ribose hydrolase n=1 Tax=Brassica campestris TaxID=3711 RepID=A0A3P6ADT1_BRACM|nr:unnamed protein product [Brassica rapa]VDC83320.1 unnamed protein product [Brassica rapa]